MGKPVDQCTKETEATALLALLSAAQIKNVSKFAKDARIPGGKAMVHQHTHAIKPISIDAAKRYAEAFGCSISAFSPRLAAVYNTPITDAPYKTHDPKVAHFVKEPDPIEVIINELVEVVKSMNIITAAQLLGRAKEMAEQNKQLKANLAG
jgi:hypothetical protein